MCQENFRDFHKFFSIKNSPAQMDDGNEVLHGYNFKQNIGVNAK